MNKRISLCILFFIPVSAFSQQNWQQEVNYKIDVTLNDVDHTLSATEEIEYINNSPETLTFLYFHLWPNAYKDRNTAFAKQQLRNNVSRFHFAPEHARGSITGLDFKVNGQPVKWEYDAKNPDIAKLTLNQPLASGQRITISTPFKVKLPDSFSRLGHVGQSYQITQWYPKPAVYDQDGWHPIPYLDQGEFYSEFGSFDVRITLPANYTVGATGVLQTAKEIARMDSLATATASITKFDKTDLDFPPSAAQTKTLHYRQDKIHDFAWFADKRFHVLKGEVILPHSKNAVTTWLLFTNRRAETWITSMKDMNDAVYYYSQWVGDYPYAHATAVDGALSAGAGMEYPMVTVTDPEAIIHEVGHNWFYGILGSNERQHPWLDEGINTYYETRVKTQRTQNAGMLSSAFKSEQLRNFFGLGNLPSTAIDAQVFMSGASRGLDQPVTAASEQFRSMNYGTGVYAKTALLFHYLENYLGTARFDSAMHRYYQQWKFRHPGPHDLQTALEKSTGEPLNWFFQDLLASTSIPDAHLANVTKTENGLTATVTQTGKLALPVQVATLDAEGNILESYWTKPNERKQTVTFKETDAFVDRVVVDPQYLFPELDRRDNQYNLHSFLPKVEPLKLQLLAGIPRIDKQQLFFMPTIGYNTYDKFMLGGAFYNHLVTEHKLNYIVMPMYAFGSKRLTGLADVHFRLPAQGFLRKVELGVQGQRFSNYQIIKPSLTFYNRLKNSITPWQQLTLSWSVVKEEFMPNFQAPQIAYQLSSSNAISGSELRLDFTTFRYDVPSYSSPFPGPDSKEETGHVSRLRLDLHNWFKYKANKEIRLRTFVGLMFKNGTNHPFYLGLAGSPDYLKEHVFFNRQEMATSLGGPASIRQTDRKDGGFRNPIAIVSQDWLAALNLTADVPVLPLTAYLDLGHVGGETKEVLYGTGFQLSFFNNMLEIYLPVAGSNFEDTYPGNFKNFRESIRYSLNLNLWNPYKLLDKMQ
ncbi:M1 family metallopeptidase [Rufibacter roseus]|uniref:M1 family metallopeptidase n=1 Tax=Rufibacter roseus TaxID=1567108 RepID=A0ABW2DMV8_9BACT|nr:M1 family metallopeptidase [Rufibacter roseus]